MDRPDKTFPSVMNHSLVLPLKTNENNHECVLYPVAELVTCNQSSLNIEIFLIKIKAAIKRKTSIYQNICDYIVIDCSFAEMNAIAKTNGQTLADYLEISFKAAQQGNIDSLKQFTLIAWCSSHYTKIVVKDVKTNYPTKTTYEVKGVLIEMIVEIMSIQTFEKLDEYIENFLILLKKQFYDEEAKEARKKLSVHFGDSHNVDNVEDDKRNKFESLESKTLYKSSPFYQKFNTFYENIEQSTSGARNEFYNENFAKVLLQKHIAFIPFFAGPFMKLDFFKSRANNGPIERFFGLEKKDNKLIHFGVLKPERIGRFVKNRQTNLEVLKKRIRLQLQTHRTVNKTREIPEDAQDNWKNKNKNVYHTKKRAKKFFVT